MLYLKYLELFCELLVVVSLERFQEDITINTSHNYATLYSTQLSTKTENTVFTTYTISTHNLKEQWHEINPPLYCTYQKMREIQYLYRGLYFRSYSYFVHTQFISYQYGIMK